MRNVNEANNTMNIRTISMTILATLVLVAVLLPRTLMAANDAHATRAVWPNPFTEGTTFQLTMPSAGVIKIAVYDITGKLMQTLHDGFHEAGNYDIYWNGKDLDGNPVPPGVYVCTLFSDNTVVKSVKVIKVNK